MNAILTSPVALLLRNKRTGEILRILNSNVETPSRIWNVSMREEMVNFLQRMENERPEDKPRSVTEELEFVKGFEYKQLKDELRVGGIYIRIFNQLGLERGALRDVSNPGLFAKDLTDVVAKCINGSKTLPEDWVKLNLSDENKEKSSSSPDDNGVDGVSTSDRRFVSVLSALRVLVRVDGLIDDVLSESSSVTRETANRGARQWGRR